MLFRQFQHGTTIRAIVIHVALTQNKARAVQNSIGLTEDVRNYATDLNAEIFAELGRTGIERHEYRFVRLPRRVVRGRHGKRAYDTFWRLRHAALLTDVL